MQMCMYMYMYIHMHVHVGRGRQFPLGFNSLKALRNKSSSVNLKSRGTHPVVYPHGGTYTPAFVWFFQNNIIIRYVGPTSLHY